MSAGEHDPIKDAIVDLWRGIVGDPSDKHASSDRRAAGGEDRVRPLALIPALIAAAAFFIPHALEKFGLDHATAERVLLVFHDYRWLLVALALVVAAVDLSRYLARRYRAILTAVVRQTVRVEPERVAVSHPAGFFAVRNAKIGLPVATIIRPKDFDEMTAAMISSGLVRRGRGALAIRRTVLDVLSRRFPQLRDRMQGWTLDIRHEPHLDRILVSRKPVDKKTKTTLSTLEQALRSSPLKDPVVSVESRDDDGVETSYRISFTASVDTGLKAFQKRVEEGLAGIAGRHVSGRRWVTEWHPDESYLILALQAPLPRRVNHPLELVDEDLRHLPYATGEADATMFWDVSTKSNKPHCLIVGPTGGGKTSVIRTLLTEAARRGIPFVGVDPKMIELDGLEGYPGCGAIVYDPVRAAMLVRALHAEMMARNHYVHVNKIEPSELPLLIAVLDEFFILSGKWQRLMKTGDDETKALLAQLDPLGAWADLAVLARSAGIRLLLGVQRPDAQLFGGASGNARDNFGTRMSLGNLSQDGALMMWGDAGVGRQVDTSIPGRGVVTAPDGTPVPAQMWWTPNVDRHPNKWNQLSSEEKDLIEGLRPTEPPKFVIYSNELRDFLESERAMAKVKLGKNAAPEPFVLGADLDDDDDPADAIPASAVTEGMTILIADRDDNLVPVTAEQVSLTRDEHGLVTETRIVLTGGGRVKTTVTFSAGEMVFLPEPDRELTAA